MTSTTAQQNTASESIVTLEMLQTAVEALRQNGDIREGGIKHWIESVAKGWNEAILTQGKEFRTDESVLEAHSLAAQQQGEWRVPYGVDCWEGYQLMREIDRRRERGISLAGLAWPPSDDPCAPANDPHHPYYLG